MPSQETVWPADLREKLDEQAKIAEDIQKKTGVPHVTAFIMAGDEMSARRADEMVAAGTHTVEEAGHLIGSYARLNWFYKQMQEKRITRVQMIELLPKEWPFADPDDSDPRWLELWREAKHLNGAYVRDGKPLPRSQMLTVYRGQHGRELGIAWSLNPKVAQKFAAGPAAFRTPVSGGKVFRGLVSRDFVLAYLTGRGEQEVIIDPRHVAL